MPKLKDATAMQYRQEEHTLASTFALGGDPARHFALSCLIDLARRRSFVTQSPGRMALVALHSTNIAIQAMAAQLLLITADPRAATAIRWKLQSKPHEMVASILKEALAKINRKQSRKKRDAA